MFIPAFLLLAGCSVEETYEPGQMEDPDCYGVWFPSQTVSTDLFLESDDPTEVTYVVKRKKITEEITVPLVVESSVEGIFNVEPLVFKAGEDQAELKVTFPDAEVGVEYTCTIRIEDPQYIEVYGKLNTAISFSILRADWKLLGTGKWRDDIFSSLYMVTNQYAEVDVEIYEREDKEGYYRINAFTPAMIEALFGVSVQTEGVMTTIDASDPEAVYFPVQETGVQLSSNDGYLKIASTVAENFSMDATESQYGTRVDGVITFPAQSIVCNFSSMPSNEWYSANIGGMLRIMLPGAKVYDYSVAFTKSEPSNGQVTIGVDLSDDVAFMGYKVFEGALDDAQASLNAQNMSDSYKTDGVSAYTGIVSSDRNLRITCPSTGEYTLVGCLYSSPDAKEMTGYGFITFGYVAADDDRPVILTAGLEATDEFGGQGYTPDNSIKFYAYGEDIRSLEYGLFRSKDLSGVAESDYGKVLDESGTSLTADELKSLNDGHFSRLLTGLNGDSDYILLLRAYNGYYSVIKTYSCHTTGTFNPILEQYSYEDFLDDQPTKYELTDKVWNYYAKNLLDENPLRRKIGQVRIEESTEDMSGVDIMTIYGLSGVEFDSGGGISLIYMPNSSITAGYKGVIAIYSDGTEFGKIDGQSVYAAFVAEEDANAYNGVGMFGGAVADGYIYFAPSPAIVEEGFTLSYLYTGSSSTAYSLMTEMILVDPDKDQGGLPDVVSSRIASIREMYMKTYQPDNFVEIPEEWYDGSPADGKKLPESCIEDVLEASFPAVREADVQVSESAPEAAVQASTDFRFKGSASRNMERSSR